MNSYQQLRQACLATATREFNARGKSVVRCASCQLAQKVCICNWRPEATINCEFVLLMHKEELFKPTNTGRLIAEIFPDSTHAFCWHRTEPNPDLINLLRDPGRLNLIVFPDDTRAYPFKKNDSKIIFPKDRLITFILLDGTWKQSGRMFHLSRWLDSVSTFSLTDISAAGYTVRKSHQQDYVSTAEAAALCLDSVKETVAANFLRDYFFIFNHHYLATRGNYQPQLTEVHHRLASLS